MNILYEESWTLDIKTKFEDNKQKEWHGFVFISFSDSTVVSIWKTDVKKTILVVK